LEVAKALGGSFKLVIPAPKTVKRDDSTAQGKIKEWAGHINKSKSTNEHTGRRRRRWSEDIIDWTGVPAINGLPAAALPSSDPGQVVHKTRVPIGAIEIRLMKIKTYENKFVRPRWPYDMRPSSRGEKYMCVSL